ncbi:MAG: SusC/RagA family TonB-linked outer membrane protein [Flavobacteriaceae bacterium]|nr:SusC/RagA family TonB-linked outer membrane protein [Flavobacteriaceae bacterium]
MKHQIKMIFFLLLGIAQLTMAQTTIRGVVSDANGPLPGANVLEQGTTNGVSTDFDGNFQISVAQGATLEISYTGFVTQYITVNNQSDIDITLEEDTQSLNEVVVTALGFTEERDKQGSTSSIVSSKAVLRSGESTLANGLSGKASGLRVSRSNGDPGAGSAIRIRGANTILGASEPLIIVDGVPLNNQTSYAGGNDLTGGRGGGVSQGSRINDINPSDIASVQILKGASAAALWGSRAANGVIVITTKEGQTGQAKISYSSTLSFDEVSERIPMQNTWGRGRGGNPALGTSSTRESWGDYIPDRSGAANTVDNSGGYFTGDSTGTVYYPITEMNSRETFVEKNWDAVFRTGIFWQNDLNISGGTEGNTYFFSLSNLQQDGIMRAATYDRTNIRFNYSADLNKYINFSNKAAYTYTNSNRIQQSSNTAGIMLGLLRTSPDFDNTDYVGTYTNSSGEQFTRRHRAYRRGLANSANPIYNNPLWTLFEQESSTTVNRVTVTPEITIKPTEWLQLIARGNIDFADDKRVYFFPIGTAGGTRLNGAYQEDEIANRDVNFDLIGRGEFEINNLIDLTATVGWSSNDRTYNRNSGTITGFLVNSLKQTTSLNTSAEASGYSNFKTFRKSNRGYAILNFGIADELFVNLTGGLEASSTIKGTFFYPAADVAWNFTNSAINSDFLSFGKIRASYGQVGVQPSPHRFETLAEGGFGYSTYSDPISIDSFGGGFRKDNNLGNPNLKPEIKTEFEIGTDLRFFDNDVSLSMTYYSNKIEDILLNVDLSPSSGYATQYGNFGEMENQGFEVDLGWNAIQKQDLQLNASINWSKNTNEVTDLFGTTSIDLTGYSVSSRAIVGHQLGVLFGTGSQTNPDGSFDLDENGFPQITPSEVILGDPNPDWRGGLGLNLTYKKFSLNVVVEHSQGGDFSPRTLHVLKAFGTTQETAGRVTLSNDIVNYAGNTIPAGSTVRGTIQDFGGGNVLLDESWYRTGIGGGFGDNQAYNFSIYDATFTKVRELSLSYTLDSPELKERIGLSNIRFTLTGRNWININEIPGIDPETNQTGVGNGFGLDYFTNPQTKSTLLSILFNF